MKKEKDYEVNFDMKSSHSFSVKAKNAVEAKKKAFEKFRRTRNRRSEYNVVAEEL